MERRKDQTILIIPFVVSVIYLIGVLVFAKGFLLNRVEIKSHSHCSTTQPNVNEPNVRDFAELDQSHASGDQSSSERVNPLSVSCSRFKRFNKVIFLVIDALRYDFATFNVTKAEDEAKPYENKLPVFTQLLREKPQNSKLFKFTADPPTTTMQRLKGLTTGSLPTFVDAGRNFASSEITEDNLIYQFKATGKRLVFMGDDTWESLFKDKFDTSYPFPSFNVKDLHTVDNGCIANLVPEIEKKTWNVIISHFLGVDHCGHRFGPDHPAMAKKLLQMNEVIKSVVNKLEEDTLLLVLGDHGMTKTGDHGGDSPEEVGAALFAYSPSQLWDKEEIQTQDAVSQIDLVPTVALLLGTPIPFSNLGRLIPHFFAFPSQELRSVSSVPLEVKPLFNYVCALHRNVRQVKTYIETYHSQTGAFSTSLLTESNTKYQEAFIMLSQITQILESQVKITAEDLNNLKKDLNETEKLLSSYHILVSNMCHEIWAQFDDFSIEIGFGIFSGMLLVSMLILFGVPVKMPYLILLQTLDSVCLWSSLPLFLLVLTLLIPASFILLKVSKMVQRLDTLPGRYQGIETDVLAVALCCMHALSLTSNSFVMSESYITSYFANSIMTFVFLWKVLKKKRSEPVLRKDRFRKNLKEWLLFLIFLIASRSSQLFLSCREEQPWCDVSPFLKPLSSLRLSKSQFLNIRYLLSGACVFLPVMGLNRWFRKLGNHGVLFVRRFSLTYGLPLTAICLWMNWALQAVPSSILDKLPAWQQTFLPRIAYLMIFGSLISVLIDPVCARLLTEEEGRQIKEAAQGGPKTKAKDKDKLSSRKKRTTNPKHQKSEGGAKTDNFSVGSINTSVPVVCGLGSVYSSNLLQVFISVFLLIALLLGDGLAPSLILMMLQMFIAVELKSLTEREENQKVPEVPAWLIALWSMMSMQYFFTTGHQATIPSIRFETAFIGYHGNYPSCLYWIPAVLIVLNTFAAQVMFAVAVPFMFLWTLTRRNLEEGTMTEVPKGEMELQLDSDLFKKGLSHLVLYYVSFQALQLCGTMLSAALHRRHLMAWGIFAPRFIFEGVSFLVTLTALSLSCGFLMFTHRALGKWIDRHLNRLV